MVAALTGLACTERLNAPGACPTYCPEGALELVDTVLFAIAGDSAFRGYVQPDDAAQLQLVARADTLTSRAVVQFSALSDSAVLPGDSVSRPIIRVDSISIQLEIDRRDTTSTGLRLEIYRLPVGRDTSDTFASLDGFFVAANLLATVSVDSALGVDDSTGAKQVSGAINAQFDASLAPFDPADDGVLAIGIAVVANEGVPFAVVESIESLDPPVASYTVAVDSAGTQARTIVARTAAFDTFVFTPSPSGLAELEVGGLPAARSLLRFTIPSVIVDSSQIVRATLVLVPTSPVEGVPADSFFVIAHAVSADFGAKSPLASDPDSVRRGQVRVSVGLVDTVTIEITSMLRIWRLEPEAPRALMLRLASEGLTFGRVRFGDSGNVGARPALQLSFFSPFGFASP